MSGTTVKYEPVIASFAIGKTVERMAYNTYRIDGLKDPPRGDAYAYVKFTDGTELLLVTDHTGPYSEVTPDVDFDVMLYQIVRSANG